MFTYYMPTKIYAGENVVLENESALILGKRAMIVTGKTSGKKSGALDDALAVLQKNGVEALVFDKVENNPTIETCAEGGQAAREFGADFLIGIGGGSPLDAAKAIAVYAVNEPIEGSDFELFDIFKGNFKNKPLPMVAIPTTAGTGSEVTPYSILTLHSIKNKKSFTSPEVFYKAAFLDGKYTVNLPLQIARNTAVDAMSHLIEGFTDKKASAGSDYIALEGLKVIGRHLEGLRKGNLSKEDCLELLWASTLGGVVISQTGTTIVHSMGYPLTYFKDIPHGLANGKILPEYLRRTEEVLPEKAKACLTALGLSSTEAFKAYLADILPFEAEISEEEVYEWTKTTIEARNVLVCPFAVTREDEFAIYKTVLFEKN